MESLSEFSEGINLANILIMDLGLYSLYETINFCSLSYRFVVLCYGSCRKLILQLWLTEEATSRATAIELRDYAIVYMEK